MSRQRAVIPCPVCGEETPSSEQFCQNCRYPVNLDAPNTLDDEDLRVHLTALAESLGKTRRDGLLESGDDAFFEAMLSAYWLRPETALYCYLQGSILRSLRDSHLAYPLLDLGCGDGLFMTLVFGGRLDARYDNYHGVDLEAPDVFNAYEELPDDYLAETPDPIGAGVDIKESSVRKARDLGGYDEVREGDIRDLTFEDRRFRAVFTNMIDDIDTEDLHNVFEEVHRVLHPDGSFVFSTPTPRFHDYLVFYNRAEASRDAGDMDRAKYWMEFDRGRSSWERRPYELWERVMEENGFESVDRIAYGNQALVELWDTGFRPYFPYLMGLRRMMRERGALLPLKRTFMEFVRNTLRPLCRNQITPEGAFEVIVAKKV